MNILRRIRVFFSWRQHHDSFMWSYEENSVTGERRAVAVRSGGYQPIDWAWIEHREERSPAAPRSGSGVYYARDHLQAGAKDAPARRPAPPAAMEVRRA